MLTLNVMWLIRTQNTFIAMDYFLSNHMINLCAKADECN